MHLMPGTTLYHLDKTDIDTLIPWYLWKISTVSGNGKEVETGTEGEIVGRGGKQYRRVKNADWI